MVERDRLTQEHRAIEAIAVELSRHCTVRPLPLAAIARIRWQLSRLLPAHLATEDRLLYPLLARDPAGDVAGLSRRMQEQMGGLAEAFKAYMRDWDGCRIGGDPDGFVRDTHRVLGALAVRIRTEESQLYRHIPPPRRAHEVDAGTRAP